MRSYSYNANSDARDNDRLILNFAELTRNGFDDDDSSVGLVESNFVYAFYNQTLMNFISDEIKSFLNKLFCEIYCVSSFCNPLYVILWLILFILSLPGILLHYVMIKMGFLDVKKKELSEEREVRSHGIYPIMGLTLYGFILNVINIFLDYIQDVELLNEVGLVVNACTIVISLIGLSIITNEYQISMRCFSVGFLTISFFELALIIIDLYSYYSLSNFVIIEYVWRFIELALYSVLTIKALSCWSLYKSKSTLTYDLLYMIVLILLFSVAVLGLLVGIIISRENSWIMTI